MVEVAKYSIVFNLISDSCSCRVNLRDDNCFLFNDHSSKSSRLRSAFAHMTLFCFLFCKLGSFLTNSDSMNITEENKRKRDIFAVFVVTTFLQTRELQETNKSYPFCHSTIASRPHFDTIKRFLERMKNWDKTSHISTLKNP